MTAELSVHDRQFRDARPREAVSAVAREPGLRWAQTVAAIMEWYADRPALGERATEVVTDPVSGRTSLRLLPEFETISYRELWAGVRAVAAEWHQDGQCPLRAGDFVALLGFTSSDYTMLDLACGYLGAVAVPLQSSAALAQLTPVVEETGPRVLAASIEYLDTAVDLALSGAQTPRVVVFDYRPEADDQREKFEAARRRLAEAGVTALDSLAAVLERGRVSPPAPMFTPGADEDPLSLLIYTSGSTGTPKGAMYTDRMVRKLWSGSLFRFESGDLPAIGINYMPLSHIAGRSSLFGTLGRGGISYFTAKSDLSTLFEDIGLVRPTELLLVPRICDMLFQEYQSGRDRRAADFDDENALDAAVKADLRERRLGGRVLEVTCGSAPLSADMAAFVESSLDLRLHDGYGSTEAGGILFDTQMLRPPVLDYKLVDVPELGYFRTDSPYPRGELLVKTENIFPGYYKRPEVTAEVFDEDGYYKTGDVMAEIAPDQLVYVDRRNNVLKLSQGEFVAVSRLEAIFVTSPLIRQIFVYGSSERAYLLAVIVPTEEAAQRAGNSAELKASLSESLQHVAKRAELNSYEIPRDFLIETKPFTTENGLLSDARKLLRPRLKERYGDRLEQLYSELAERQADELRTLRRSGAEAPVLATVSRAAQALLGSSSADLDATTHFTELGGDSLSALSFSNLLREIFDIEVPVGVIISPANDLRQIANYIEAQRAPGAKRPAFATVHGQDSTEIHAGDLRLDKFIDTGVIAAAKTLPRPSGGTPHTVLLTGANGYLGRFLCLDWLQRLAETGGTLICIVRGTDATAARTRLDAAFDSGDAELIRHYQELAAEHLEVLAGDIGEPNLGLDEKTWNRLAENVDLIMHPAALVNHVLPYNQVFGPNVVGTAELIRMAITSKIKPFTHLSTVGVVAQLDPSALDEDTDIRVLSPTRTLDGTYANGYGTSKWAGEVLLREAHEACGLPVTVFRSDMILAHSRYTGQLNVPDMFTRLLLSLITTGIAPRSFYRTDAQGNRPRAHYEGLPVDFTAEAVAKLGAHNTSGYRTFNTLNPYDDGISLDVFVDWLNQAGYPVQRIDNYQDWFARFDTAIRALPETQRQHSLLPLLHSVQQPSEPIPGSAIPAERFHTAVRDAKIGADKDIPHLSAALIGKYATDLQQLGLL
ncbi:carboxylic acid reductase [Streptomyces halobius]|uniref:Carboxylic acid reductase n=1 Tax=Streptomyces halobius TaxID=2879846 RepID=A0ABY4M3X2_9ACTN|nr:carboxylic acid reductase [Streptomyces halobius]UQA91544.1 carboxylic acid reductase [Streptomyces halobius]